MSLFFDKWVSLALLVLLIVAWGCTTRPRVQMDVDSTNNDSSGRVIFSQPF